MNFINKLFAWLFISKEDEIKLQKAMDDFSAGKINENEWMRIVWTDFPY